MAGIAAEGQLIGRPPRARRRRDGVRFELVTPADDAAVRRLLRENPMLGRIAISLEREPDARLAAAVEGDVHHTIVARDGASGRLIAMGSVSVRDRYINGELTRVGYLGQLRLDHSQRSRASIILGGYALFRELHESLGVKLYLTSIASDNSAARRFLERGLPGMPTYRPLDAFVTNVLEPRRASRTPRAGLHVDVCDASRLPERLPDVLDCLERNGRRRQFAPVWRESDVIERVRSGELHFVAATRGGRVVGCAGVWDQSAYKQTVVRGYGPRLMRWRTWVKVARTLVNLPHLPPVGTKLDLVYLSHVTVDDDDNDREVFAALLEAACDRCALRGELSRAQLVLGLSERHAQLQAVPRGMVSYAYRTNLYAVHWDDGRAAAEALDGRPCDPEVALL